MKKNKGVLGAVTVLLVIAGITAYAIVEAPRIVPGEVSNDGEDSAMEETGSVIRTQLAAYSWKKWNISFRYPKTLTVHMPGEDRLFVNEESRMPEGTLTSSWTRMDIVRDTTMAKRITEYRSLSQFSESTVTFGKNSFTRITYRDAATKRPVTRYLKELNNILFEYTVGENEGWLANTILSTMQFPKQ